MTLALHAFQGDAEVLRDNVGYFVSAASRAFIVLGLSIGVQVLWSGDHGATGKVPGCCTHQATRRPVGPFRELLPSIREAHLNHSLGEVSVTNKSDEPNPSFASERFGEGLPLRFIVI